MNCEYRVAEKDGFGTEWVTACGHRLYKEVPEEVGICFAPKPTEGGAIYCRWCGKLIDCKE